MSSNDNFWEQPDVVARFAEREPDHRLLAIVEAVPHPERLKVLDIGCAGGRNSAFMARAGADILAVDLSGPMVEETRRRLTDIVGADEARSRVRLGSMDDLSWINNGAIDLVIALGIYHESASIDHWHRTVTETARVLRTGGELLVAHFAPGTDMTGHSGRPLPGADDLFETRDGNRMLLLSADRMDELMAQHALVPVVATETVVTPLEEGGRRVTVNARYRKGEE